MRRLAWLGAALLLAAPAHAQSYHPPQSGTPGNQTPTETGAEIVVTAPSASDTTALSDAPANVQVLRGDALIRQDHSNLADLLNANLGSVSLSNGTGSPYQSDVAYRGFQATSLLGSPTGLSVYVDGVRMNEPFGAIVNWDLIPLNAISSIEVIPGSNPLFGLNTLGGSLVLATRNGADNSGTELTVQGGSFDRRAVSGEAGGKLGDGALDWFVAGNYDQQAGYRWYTDTLVRQAYGKLRWHGGGAHAELAVTWANNVLHGTQGLPLSMLAMPKMAYTWPDDVANRQLIVNLKGDAPLSDEVRISGNAYFRRSNASSANSNASLDDGCSSEQNCSNSASGGTALNLFQANPFQAGSPAAANFSPYPGGLPLQDFTSNIDTTLVESTIRQAIFGGNLLLDIDAKPLGIDSDINLGASAEAANISYDQATYLAYLVNYETVLEPHNLLYASPAGFQGNPLINAVALSSRDSAINFFARDMIRLTPQLSLTGSIGYAISRIDITGTNDTFLGANGGYTWTGEDAATYYNPSYIGALSWVTTDTSASALVPAAIPAGGVAGPEVDPLAGAHVYRRLNPSIGLAWNPAKALGLFADFSEAMRAPTAIELACANSADPCALPTGFNGDPDLRAVVAHTVEMGARGTVRGNFSWNFAVYRTLLDNDIQFIYTPSGLGYFANVGRTERQGFEVGASANLARLHLTASYGYVQATYRSPFADADGDEVMPGDHITGIPDQSFKLRAVYTLTKALTLGSNLIAVSSQYAHGDEANLATPVPGYALVNLDLHYQPRPELELFANITNLFDRRYATFGVMGSNVYTGADEQFRTPEPGRAFLLGVRFRLGPIAQTGK